MGRLRPPQYKRRACAPTEHKLVLNKSGYEECKYCGLSPQTLVDDVGHSRGDIR